MPILGSAGHVDHGKSSLLRALTGQEPDRLPEEKKRGMTIDLNFVSLRTRSGVVGIVDVPGHQRFVKNMISGTMAVDAFLFVCAADDGWMPQSEEHLSVLKSLGITRGIGVVTKVDTVDASRAAEVAREVREKLESAFGSTPKVFRFAAPRPDTLPDIREAIETLVAELPAPLDLGAPRLWIDRVFVPRGLGVVATGTLREGVLREGDELEVLPSGKSVTVKSLQAYHESVKEAPPNTRVALLLGKVQASDLERGMLLQRGKQVPLTRWIETKIDALEALRRDGHYAFHVGTTRVEARVVPLGESHFARLRFPEALPLRAGDRFVLRTPGEERMVASGVVVDPEPAIFSHKGASDRLVAWRDDAAGLVSYELKKRGYCDLDRTVLRAPFSRQALEEALHRSGAAPAGPSLFVDKDAWESARQRVKAAVETQAAKTRAAVSGAELAAVVGRWGSPWLSALLASLVEKNEIRRDDKGFLPARALASLDKAEQERREKIRSCFAKAGGQPLTLRDLELAVPRVKPTLAALVKEGSLVSLPEEHFVDAETYEAWKQKVADYLRERGQAAIGELRTYLGTSRKNAVVMLERMDRDKLTYLKDGVRRLFRDPGKIGG